MSNCENVWPILTFWHMEGTRNSLLQADMFNWLWRSRIVSETSQAGLIKKESCLTWLRRRERNVANGIVSKERVVCENTGYVLFLHFSWPEEQLNSQNNLAEYSQTLAEYLEPVSRLLTDTEYLKLAARYERQITSAQWQGDFAIQITSQSHHNTRSS